MFGPALGQEGQKPAVAATPWPTTDACGETPRVQQLEGPRGYQGKYLVGLTVLQERAFPRNKHFWNRLAVMLLLNWVFPHGHLCLLFLFTRKNRQITVSYTHLRAHE